MANANEPVMDRLTGQLYHLPGIIGNLGISVANAQKALNSDYIRNVQIVIDMIAKMLENQNDPQADTVAVVKELLKQLAPSRYQFTQTTLEFHADLAERKQKDMQAALGGGFSSVTISAGYAKSFGYDYRAAARVTAVLDALPANDATFQALVDKAKDIKLKAEDLPEKYQIEKEIFNGLATITNALTELAPDKEVKKIETDGGGD